MKLTNNMALASWFVAVAASLMPGYVRADERPNIVLILSDDHCRQTASCYGSELISTPGLDRLAREGMRFTNMTVPNSLCSPSRAVILTGKYSCCNSVARNGD